MAAAPAVGSAASTAAIWRLPELEVPARTCHSMRALGLPESEPGWLLGTVLKKKKTHNSSSQTP